jgi:hypothetical protein
MRLLEGHRQTEDQLLWRLILGASRLFQPPVDRFENAISENAFTGRFLRREDPMCVGRLFCWGDAQERTLQLLSGRVESVATRKERE